MIKPTKFLNLESCVINVSKEIIIALDENESLKYSELQSKLKHKLKEGYEYNFIPALDFLFLLGKLKYSPNTDSLELIK
ncbi:hypothetical protein QJR30_01660 [Paraclostridium sordellii]|uniref:ABC-three component system middle component 8 n=1 Tax=Paraclostridium sordellii TaxID=1505 RepID=UPI0005E720C2|nr:ABC-three component system middle component 8 [Paeniclostridium sordellii]CEP81960.1 Uncharacterised protein [[Clostridium] sordellii] [Paeniclostridium sordellii]